MRSFTKLISALLLICICLSVISCQNAQSPNVTTSTSSSTGSTTTAPSTNVEPPVTEPVSFNLTKNFKIVRPAEPDTLEMNAAKLLSRGIKSAYGFSCSTVSDFAPGGNVKPNEFEILVGNTNRNESKEAYSSLAYYDYKYEIVSENVILICGGSYEATYSAVECFLSDILGYKEDAETEEVISAGTPSTLVTLTKKTFESTYPVKTLKIGTRDFSEYSLVVTDTDFAGIDTIIGGFSRLCGNKIKVVDIKDYTSGPAIFLGCNNANGDHYKSDVYGNSRYYITESGENIFIDFKSDKADPYAAERFVSEYLSAEPSESFTVSFKGAENVITGVGVASDNNGLALVKTTTEELAPGVYYIEQLYHDRNGAPVRTHSISVKKGSASIVTSLPSAGLGKVTNVKNMLLAERAAGKNAIATINADFFDMGGTNLMKGLCIVDGEELRAAGMDEWFGKTWFGITKDGEAVIGTASEYEKYKGKLQHAVGGSNIILINDVVSNLNMGEEFSYTRHPRTAVGITADGDVVLTVVDGRQSSVSNGAAMSDLAYIMSTFGCCDAVNLDGGGSSGLVISDSEGNISIKNSPSDGALRSVANGLTVVLP